jgi:hypothetical protein
MSRQTRKVVLPVLLLLLGAGYFGLFSQFEVPALLKSQLVLLPVQVGTLVYLLGWRQRLQRRWGDRE